MTLAELRDRLKNQPAAEIRRDAPDALEQLRQHEHELFGKKGFFTVLNKALGALPAEERREAGALINEERARQERALADMRQDIEGHERRRMLEAERLDLTEVMPGRDRGHLHLTTQTRDELEDVFIGMGYQVAEGPEAEDDWHNFEALNMPPAHPARSMWDTFYLELGEPESVVLRTHTSPVQIRVMEAQGPPIHAVMPGRVYRYETPDPRHLAVFHQIEGLVVDKGISFADLAGTIETFTSAYFGPEIHARLRPSYFPFTEPSAEFEVTCIFCEGAGCRVCSHTGWIELGGCGMVHPNVLRAGGIDPEEWTGFAFGFGIDRLAQIRHQVDDERDFLVNDIRFLEQF
ncbi:MAG: phenylalanine--tRNA ligase subunit alpha [Acidimicrobiia bacterium]|nr:phenylalanine--tRNA ligase subunit alpha [Acidimicrobiia bacterium]